LDDAFGWLFIDGKPLLFERKHVARQVKIDTWLDLADLLKELTQMMPAEGANLSKQADYVV
jgi:hypothetical protein